MEGTGQVAISALALRLYITTQADLYLVQSGLCKPCTKKASVVKIYRLGLTDLLVGWKRRPLRDCSHSRLRNEGTFSGE